MRERVALAQTTKHLLSPVLLLQTAAGARLHEALAAAAVDAGVPTVRDLDQAGRVHEVWALADGETSDRLLTLAGTGELSSQMAITGALPRKLLDCGDFWRSSQRRNQ